MSARSSLKIILNELRELAVAMNRTEDLQLIDIADGKLQTPSERLRTEVGERYAMNTDRTTSRALPDNAYQHELLDRTRKV